MLIKDIEPDAQSFDLPSTEFFGGRGGSQDTYVKNRNTLDIIIDLPCLEACRYLFDCNILTLASSANKTNISSDPTISKGFITIDYSSLDDNNKMIFKNLVEKGAIKLGPSFEKSNHFNLEVSIANNTSAEEFSEQMLSLAHFFQPQEILYGSYTIEEFQNYVAERISSAKTFEGQYFIVVILERLNNGEILEDPDGEIQFEDGRCISFDTLCQEYAKEYDYFYDDAEERYWIDKELFEKAKNIKNGMSKNGIKR